MPGGVLAYNPGFPAQMTGMTAVHNLREHEAAGVAAGSDSLLADLARVPSRLRFLAYATWISFVARYRRTAIGPLWIVISPLLFIALVGTLFSAVSNIPAAQFFPHVTVGYIVWMFIFGVVNSSAALFVVNRADLLQGGTTLADVGFRSVMYWFFQFLHHVPIMVVCLAVFGGPGLAGIVWACAAMALVIINCLWITLALAILGTRFRDVREIVESVMRIMFLCTPIIWMPNSERGQLVGAFLTLNPFYHYLEIVRAPLLGMPVPLTSWLAVIAMTAAGFLATSVLYRRYNRYVALWL